MITTWLILPPPGVMWMGADAPPQLLRTAARQITQENKRLDFSGINCIDRTFRVPRKHWAQQYGYYPGWSRRNGSPEMNQASSPIRRPIRRCGNAQSSGHEILVHETLVEDCTCPTLVGCNSDMPTLAYDQVFLRHVCREGGHRDSVAGKPWPGRLISNLEDLGQATERAADRS